LVGLLSVANARPFGGSSITLPDYGRLSLSFIPNAGQSDGAVRYLAQTPGMRLFFTDDGLTFSGIVGFTFGGGVGGE
jgi:hypothetical protein